MTDLFWGWGAHQARQCPEGLLACNSGFPGEAQGVLWQNKLVLGMLSRVISGCWGKELAEPGSLCIKGLRLLCTHSSWVLRSGCRGAWPPELAVPPGQTSPRGCQPGGCQSSASGCNKGGDLILVGIVPCRAANSVTRGEVSLPPCTATRPRHPQLVPGGGAATPWLIPWLLPGSSHCTAWAGLGGGMNPHPAGLFQPGRGCSLVGKPWWRLSPSLVAALFPKARC